MSITTQRVHLWCLYFLLSLCRFSCATLPTMGLGVTRRVSNRVALNRSTCELLATLSKSSASLA